MVFLDKYGWPVEKIKGRPFTNFIRILLHADSVKRGRWNAYEVVTNGIDIDILTKEKLRKAIDSITKTESGPRQ